MQRLEIRGEYPPDVDVVFARVKDAAGWRCVRCGHAFDRETGRSLDCDVRCDPQRGGHRRGPECVARLNYGVHHLDGDKANSAWWNLLAQCNSCHLHTQHHVIVERSWLFPHSEWFVPYVCGFYAAFYRGAEITRAEAIADPDRWLALNPARRS